MKIRTKIIISGLIVTILFGYTVWISITTMQINGKIAQEIGFKQMQQVQSSGEALRDLVMINIFMRNLIIFDDTIYKKINHKMTKKKVLLKKIKIKDAHIASIIEAYSGKSKFNGFDITLKSKFAKGLIKDYNKALPKFHKERSKIINAINSGDRELASKMLVSKSYMSAKKKYKAPLEVMDSLAHIETNKSISTIANNSDNAIYNIVVLGIIGILAVMLVMLVIILSVYKPLKIALISAEAIANGDFSNDIPKDQKDEIGLLLKSMNQMSYSVHNVVSEINTVANMAANGELDARTDSENFDGEYKNIMLGFNTALDSVITPLKDTANSLSKISEGHIPKKSNILLKGDFIEIQNDVNALIDVISSLVNNSKELSDNIALGNLTFRINDSLFKGDFNTLMNGINTSIDNLMKPFNYAIIFLNQVATGHGDLIDIKEDLPGDYKQIIDNINDVKITLKSISNISSDVRENVINGNLAYRVDTTKVRGDWVEIFAGYNDIIEAFSRPINVTLDYISRISNGNIPEIITDEYYGDFNEIKLSINNLINTLNLIITETDSLSKSTIAGRLNIRINSAKFSGDYAKLVQGINNNLDAVITPLNLLSELIRRISVGDLPPIVTANYNGDYNEIKNSINHLIETLGTYTNSTISMVSEFENGNTLATMDTSQFEGVFNDMASGVNDMVGDLMQLMSKVIDIINSFGNGDFSKAMEDLPGEKMMFSKAVNNVRSNLLAFSSELETLIDFVKTGNLNKRGNAETYKGDWKTLVIGVNDIIESVFKPLSEAGITLEKMAQGDLTQRMIGQYEGDFQTLKVDINELGESLSSLVLDVKNVVLATSNSAESISHTADTLAAAAQEQNAQADEVASSVEDMARTVSDNASGATQTAETSQANTNLAISGAEVVGDTINKMKDIAKVVSDSTKTIQKLGDASKTIGEIISVIDDISDQTNLLALNAAIEAARAGEHGRGFAVVADEVRKLAERTTGATKQIFDMVKDIQRQTDTAVIAMNQGNKEVQVGIELADNAGESLSKIKYSSENVSDLITQIATATEEQSATTDEISKNIIGISQATAESAKQIEYVATSAINLTETTENLQKIMSRFTVNNIEREQKGKLLL